MGIAMALVARDEEMSLDHHHLQFHHKSNGPNIDTAHNSSTPHTLTPNRHFTPATNSPEHNNASSHTPALAGFHTPTRHSLSNDIITMATGSNTPHTPRTPRTPWTPSRLLNSPIGTPVRKVMTNIKSYLEDVGHLAKFNPQDAWLPITESRTGNAFYAIFHNVNAGIGFQGLLLPYAMFYLGWYDI